MKLMVKSTLMAAALSLAAFSGAGAANVDGPDVFWKWSVWGNPRAFTAGVEKLAARVAEETGGKFKIQIFYGGQLAKSKEHLDGIKNNAFEGGFFCNFYHPGKNPAFMAFTMPFIPLGDWEVSAYVLNVSDEENEHRSFSFGDLGYRQIMFERPRTYGVNVRRSF